MNTIKNTGLRNIIEQGDIYNYNYYIEDVLSEDLTAEEIEASQAIITSVTPHIKEVFEKLNLLYEKICPLSTQVDELNKSISNLVWNIVSMWGIGAIILVIFQIGLFVVLERGLPEKLFFGLLGTGLLVCIFVAIFDNNKLRKQLNIAKQELNLLNQEKNALLKSISAPSFVDIEQGLMRLETLSKLLQKLYLIITDKQTSQTERLLAIENFFYMLHKKQTNNKLVDEAKKATYYAQQQLEQQQANTRELEKQTAIIREKARLDESRRKDGEAWRF